MSMWPFLRGVLARLVPISFMCGAAIEFTLIKGNFCAYPHNSAQWSSFACQPRSLAYIATALPLTLFSLSIFFSADEHEKVRFARRRDEMLDQFGDFDGALEGHTKLRLPSNVEPDVAATK